jgi:RNA polymerase sigma-70 factor, ECF subfamily
MGESPRSMSDFPEPMLTPGDGESRHAAERSPVPSGLVDSLHEQFTALVSRHHTALMGYVLSLVPNWNDAEDILQQTSVVLWRKFGDFRLGSDFLSWACQIARFHVLNHLRKQGRDRHVFSLELVETLASEGVQDAERLEAERGALRACLEKLDARSRDLLAACYAAGATIKQVAQLSGRTPNAVYKGLNRIREALLRCVRRTLAKETG